MSTKGKPPTHGIYITPDEGKKGRWLKIGAGWQHKDTRGVTLIFEALPVSGRASLRLIEDEVNHADGTFNDAASGGQQ